MKHVAVIGAGGYVGDRLIPRLIEEGFAVTVVAPSVNAFLNRPWSNSVNLCYVPLPATSNLRDALDGVEVVYYIPDETGLGGDEIHSELEKARAFAAHARGLEKVVVLGNAGLNAKGKVKAAMNGVANILRGAAPVIEIVTGPVIGEGSAPFELLLGAVQRLPFLATGAWGRAPVSVIGIEDLLKILVKAGVSSAVGIYRCGCSTVTIDRLLEKFAYHLGHPRQVVMVPWFPIHLAAAIASFVTPLDRHQVERLLRSASRDSVEPDSKSYVLLQRAPSSIDEVLLAAIEHERRNRTQVRWNSHVDSPGEVPSSQDDPNGRQVNTGGQMGVVRTEPNSRD